jgi:UDP-N-acetyl-D-glucosamine dehydrogenase
MEFAKAGFPGYGNRHRAIQGLAVESRRVVRPGCPTDTFGEVGGGGKFRATSDFSVISDLDTINIAVPTPLRKTKDPDMSYIVSACQAIAKYLGPGKLVILESTTYPGTTDELVLPMLERPGWKVGEDFFLCFSPERVDPGNPQFQTANIPKVVGGITPACTKLGALFYAQALEKVVPVSSTSVAEMVKLLENTFRMINIGLVNEMALMCDRMGINVWEVIDAAATKPFGFMPFYPGPGLGGHCIPIDPFYLSWKTKQAGIEARFHRAGRIHQRADAALRGGQDSERAERSLQAAERLARAHSGRRLQAQYRRCARIARAGYHSAAGAARRARHVQRSVRSTLQLDDHQLKRRIPSRWPGSRLRGSGDRSQRRFDYAAIVDRAKLIVDTRNALKNHPSPKIVGCSVLFRAEFGPRAW